MIRLLKFPVLIVVMLSCGFAYGQRLDDPVTNRERAMKFYEQGKDDNAIKELIIFVKRYTTDARAWHYLGLALGRKGETEAARKAHENAVRNAIELTREYLVKAEPDLQCVMVRPISAVLTEAAESADKYLELGNTPSASTVAEWNALADELRHYLKKCDQSSKDVDLPGSESLSTRAQIIRKPTPEYTEEARRNQTSGTIVLFTMFDVDGTVKAIVPIVSLPNGLTEQAIIAARGVKFNPASKNGKPVPQFIRIEYNFNTN